MHDELMWRAWKQPIKPNGIAHPSDRATLLITEEIFFHNSRKLNHGLKIAHLLDRIALQPNAAHGPGTNATRKTQHGQVA